MKVLIFGCGRTGSTLALELVRRGHEVTLIEQNPSALIRLGENHGCNVVLGSGLEEDTLERAGIREADVFFAATRGDNSNLMAAQVARFRFQVPRICIKCADPLRAEAYRRLGYVCITPSLLTAGLMRDWLLGEPSQPIDAYNVLPDALKI
ncbi:MAG: TrkA family potassium uptake protein [Nitrospirae bacterium]|nr:TrkA family potassium uptake protein [Fimbriimonadaceae bacterium]